MLNAVNCAVAVNRWHWHATPSAYPLPPVGRHWPSTVMHLLPIKLLGDVASVTRDASSAWNRRWASTRCQVQLRPTQINAPKLKHIRIYLHIFTLQTTPLIMVALHYYFTKRINQTYERKSIKKWKNAAFLLVKHFLRNFYRQIFLITTK